MALTVLFECSLQVFLIHTACSGCSCFLGVVLPLRARVGSNRVSCDEIVGTAIYVYVSLELFLETCFLWMVLN